MSQWSNWQAQVDDSGKSIQDEEELDETESGVASKEVLLFVVEVTPSMMAPLNTQEGPANTLVATFDLVLDLMKRKVVTNNKDLVGLVLFNTQETIGDKVWGEPSEHMALILPPEPVNVDSIQKLSKLVQKIKADPNELRQFRPWDGVHDEDEEGSRLAVSLDTCVTGLKSIGGTADKRMVLVTDNDDPYPASLSNSPAARQSALTRAGDIREAGYKVQPIFISRDTNERSFDADRFFCDYFAQFQLDLSDEATLQSALVQGDASNMFQDLKDQFHHKSATRRPLFTIPFILGEDLEIGVQGFSLVTETKKGLAVTVDTSGRHVQIVKSIVTYDDKDSGGKSDSGEPAHKIVFNDDEIKALKTMGMKPSLRLLGFTTLERFQPEHQIKHAYFIYPTENAIKLTGKSYTGSKRVFSSLLQTLVQKNKIGLGVFLPRTTSTPTHVLIVPQEEVVENGKQVEPPGFHLLQLAHADDIRNQGLTNTRFCERPDEDDQYVGSDVVESMKTLVRKKLKLKEFAPDSFPNPVLNYHYNCLQAIALKEPMPEAFDETQPRYAGIRKRAGPTIQQAKEQVESHPDASALPETSGAGKKKAPAKRKRDTGSDTEEEEVDDGLIASRIEEGKTGKVRVVELQAYCKKHKIVTKAKKKADLLEVVSSHLAGGGENVVKKEEDD